MPHPQKDTADLHAAAGAADASSLRLLPPLPPSQNNTEDDTTANTATAKKKSKPNITKGGIAALQAYFAKVEWKEKDKMTKNLVSQGELHEIMVEHCLDQGQASHQLGNWKKTKYSKAKTKSTTKSPPKKRKATTTPLEHTTPAPLFVSTAGNHEEGGEEDIDSLSPGTFHPGTFHTQSAWPGSRKAGYTTPTRTTECLSPNHGLSGLKCTVEGTKRKRVEGTKRKRVAEKDFRELKRMVKGTNTALEELVFSKDRQFHGTRVSPEQMEYSDDGNGGKVLKIKPAKLLDYETRRQLNLFLSRADVARASSTPHCIPRWNQ